MLGLRRTITSVAEELIDGLRSGAVQPGGPVSPLLTMANRPATGPGLSGRQVGAGVAALVLFGVTVGWFLSAGTRPSLSGLDAPLLATLTPIVDPNKGPTDGAPVDVRVRDASSFQVPENSSLVIETPRTGFAQIIWVDPSFEIPVQVFPGALSSPFKVSPARPQRFDGVPDVKNVVVAFVVITPEAAGHDLARLANAVAKNFGAAIHARSSDEIGNSIDASLRRDSFSRRFRWIAIGRIRLEPAQSSASAVGHSDRG